MSAAKQNYALDTGTRHQDISTPISRAKQNDAANALLTETQARCQRLQETIKIIYGNTPRQEEISKLVQEFLSSCQRLIERGTASTVPIVLLGRTGEGKGWLARCFLNDEAYRKQIPSGPDARDRSQQLLWIGPCPPGNMQQGAERFIQVPESAMLDLGSPYIVGDAPGFSTLGEAINIINDLARTSGAIKLIVLRFEQLRDGETEELFRQSGGGIPVIRFRNRGQANPSPEQRADVEKYLARWRDNNSDGQVMDPIFIPDADLYGDGAIELVRQRLQKTLQPILADRSRVYGNVESEIRVRRKALAQRIGELTSELRQQVKEKWELLNSTTSDLADRLASRLLGNDEEQRVLVRRHLRGWWLERTPVWAFPYRTILRLLMLTENAWDRLVLSFMGSKPSAVLTFWQMLRNLGETWKSERRWRISFADRFRAEVESQLQPVVHAIHRIVNQYRQEEYRPAEKLGVRVVGIEDFQNRCYETVQKVVAAHAETHRWGPFVWASMATAVFAFFMAGPILTVYRRYLSADYSALTGQPTELHDFLPAGLGHFLYCLVISAIPVFILAMFAASMITSSRTTNRLVEKVQADIQKLIKEWQDNAMLRIEYDDPLVKALETLEQELHA
jgi:hypothetical protein